MNLTRRLAMAVGPGLTGALLLFMPLPGFFSLNALTYILSAACILALGRRFAWRPQRPAGSATGLRGILGDIAGALALVRDNPVMFWAIALLGLCSVAWGVAFMVGAPMLADRVFGAGAATYGWIAAAYGAGNVVSNLVMAVVRVERRVLVLFAGGVIYGGGLLLFGFSPNVPTALACAAFAAIGGPMTDVTILVIMQTEFPAHQIGKVFSLRTTVSSVGISIGLVLAGPLYAWLSIPGAIAVVTLPVIVAAVAAGLRVSTPRAPAPVS